LKEVLPTVIPKAEKTIEGRALRFNEINDQNYEGEYFVVIEEHQLEVREGASKEGKIMYSF
jgi:hypothetical protein